MSLFQKQQIEEEIAPEITIEARTSLNDSVVLGRHLLRCGECIEIMGEIPESSIDSIVTDPPYGLGFMGKQWDCSVPGEDFANELFRILKPGAHGILFAATRTIHRLTSILEDAGFEVRDQIGWLQWQGFPKSLNISKAFDKEAGAEREIIGENPNTKAGIAGHKSKYIGGSVPQRTDYLTAPATEEAKTWDGWGTALKPSIEPAVLIRKPLDGTVIENIRRWGVGALNIDATRIQRGDSAWPGPDNDYESSQEGRWPANIYVCPKPSTRERGPGNTHPTVKPIKIMRWLCRLITPKGGTILEPFGGSGTTLLAAHYEGFKAFVIERETEYCDIIRSRFEYST